MVWWGNPTERVHLEDPGVEERIILKWICKKYDGTLTRFIWHKIK